MLLCVRSLPDVVPPDADDEALPLRDSVLGDLLMCLLLDMGVAKVRRPLSLSQLRERC